MVNVVVWIERCLFEGKVMPDEEGSWRASPFARCFWLLFGLVVLLFGIGILERKGLYYFTQDDNFAQSLPIVLEGGRAFMKGAILDWSPYQFLGFPAASIGWYALTYPPTYLSYAIARYLLGNEFLTLDVFCILHLIAGYICAYWLLRRNKLHPSLAAAGSLSFVFSGYTLITGRSWSNIIASVAWMPLLFLSVTALQQNKPTWKWVVGTGCALGIFFHIGHAQIWLYTVMFFLFSIAALFCLGRLPAYKLLYLIPALLLGLAIIMPLLIPQWSVVAGVPRYASGEGIPYKGILAMLLPFPLIGVAHPQGWGAAYDQGHMAPFYYSGTLFTAVFLAALLFIPLLLFFRKNKRLLLKRIISNNLWIICALLAFILAKGERGLLWTIQAQLPLFNKFRMPFKFLPFVNLFVAIGAGMIVERCIRYTRHKTFWRVFPGTVVCALMLYNANLSTASFYSYADRPGPSRLPPEMAEVTDSCFDCNSGRTLSLVAERSPKVNYIFSLFHNFPTLLHVCAFGGYDPFIDNSPYFTRAKENLYSHFFEAARAYGIKWIIVEEKTGEGEIIDSRTRGLADFFLAHGNKRTTFADYSILEVRNPQPIAFAQKSPRQALPVHIKSNGLDIDVSRIMPDGGRVIINMLWRPQIAVLCGREKLLCQPDRWGRVITEVPPRVSIVAFRYITPWKAGFIAGALCLFGAILTYFLLPAWVKNLKGPKRS